MSQTKAQLIDPVDGSLVNADINASAAIAGTKIAPDFGNQAVTTTGSLSCFAATISGDNQDSLNFSGSSTNANRGIAFNSKTAFSHSNDSALRINNNAEFSSVNIFAVDNATSAFTLNQGSNEYITVDTNNSSELITLGNTTTNPKTVILGGNVGIGTASPTKVLEVSGSSSPEILLKPSDATPGLFIGDSNRTSDGQHLAEFGARWNGTKVARIVMQAGDDTTNKDNGQLVFFTSATGTTSERLRINEQGDIGINESAPSARLHVNGGSGLLVERSAGTSIAGFKHSGASAMNIYFQNSGSTNHPSIGSSNEDLTVGTGNNERMRINSSGFVGINSTSPQSILHVQNGSLANGTIFVGANYNGSGLANNSDKSGAIHAPMYDSDTFPKGVRLMGHYSSNTATLLQLGGGTNSARSATTVIFYTAANKSANGAEKMRIDSSGHVTPGSDNAQDLGSSSKRWQNIYTNDLKLSNEGSQNDVDSTWGNYTIQEGHEDLFLINHRTGKKFKFNLTEVA